MVTCWPSATSSMPTVTAPPVTWRGAVPAAGRVQHRLGLGHRAAAELGLHPGHQRRDQVRLPRRPRRGAGGRAVGLGEGVQQLQDGGVGADRRRRPGRSVAGSSMSRRVAVAGQQQVVAHQRGRASRRPAARTPSASAIAAAIGSPTSLWSPGQPLPMSCSSAATSSRSGRSTSRVSSAAAAAASTRWRSTVNRCQGWRCGSERTRSHSGQQPGQQALLVQLLEHRHGGAPAGQQPEERPAHLGRPRLGQRRAVHREHLERVRREQQVRARRGGRGAAAAGRGRRPAARPARARPRRPGGRRPRRAARGAPGGTGRADGAPAPASTRRQVSSATKASRRPARLTSRSSASSSGRPSAVGHRPLLLADQDVGAAGRCAGAARRGRRAGTRRPPRARPSARRRAGPRRRRAAPGPRAGRRRPP